MNKVEQAIRKGYKVKPVYKYGSVVFDVVFPDGTTKKGSKSITPSSKVKGRQSTWNVQNQMKIIYQWLYDNYIDNNKNN